MRTAVEASSSWCCRRAVALRRGTMGERPSRRWMRAAGAANGGPRAWERSLRAAVSPRDERVPRGLPYRVRSHRVPSTMRGGALDAAKRRGSCEELLRSIPVAPLPRAARSQAAQVIDRSIAVVAINPRAGTGRGPRRQRMTYASLNVFHRALSRIIHGVKPSRHYAVS